MSGKISSTFAQIILLLFFVLPLALLSLEFAGVGYENLLVFFQEQLPFVNKIGSFAAELGQDLIQADGSVSQETTAAADAVSSMAIQTASEAMITGLCVKVMFYVWDKIGNKKAYPILPAGVATLAGCYLLALSNYTNAASALSVIIMIYLIVLFFRYRIRKISLTLIIVTEFLTLFLDSCVSVVITCCFFLALFLIKHFVFSFQFFVLIFVTLLLFIIMGFVVIAANKAEELSEDFLKDAAKK